MRSIVGWVLKNKSVVVLATVLLLVAGAYSATQLNQELLPDTEFPFISVATPVPGAGPEVVDEQVSQQVSSAVEGVGGVRSVNATSSPGFSVVDAEFEAGTDLSVAEEEVRANIENLALPEQSGDPEVERASSADEGFPVEQVSLAADGEDGNDDDEELGDFSDDDLQALSAYAREEVVPPLEEVEGVSGVELAGGSERVIEVELDPQSLRDNNVTADIVTGAVEGANVNAPIGEARIEGLSTPLRATSELSDVEALRQLPVGVAGGAGGDAGEAGAPPEDAPADGAEAVVLGDVAEVQEVDSGASGIARADGEQSLAINISKEPDANTVEVSEGVERVLTEVRDDLGDGEQVRILYSDAEIVTESVNELVLKAVIGAVLAVAVILLFLRSVRATLVTAVSLPVSILAALLFSWAFDLTLNVITLAGLTIAIGRVVDDAIVVLENSYRYVQMGHDPDEAALRGTTEVASAITSSTLATVAVFLPLGLVGGLVSQLFLPLSLTVTFALLASLLVAVTIIPVLVSVFIGRRKVSADGSPEGGTGDDESSEDRASERESAAGRLVRLYTPALGWSLRHRWLVMLAALVVFVAGLGMAAGLPQQFFPEGESNTLQAQIELPAGTTVEETGEELRDFEEFLLDDSDVETYQVSAGGSSEGAFFTPTNQASATITVEEGAFVSEVQERIEDEGKDLYGDREFSVSGQDAGPASNTLEATITGTDGVSGEDLDEANDLVVEELRDNADLRDVESDLTGGAPEVSVELDPEQLAQTGLSPALAAQSLAALFGAGGGEAGAAGPTINGTPVSVGVSREALDDLDAVRNLPVAPGLTVADVATVEETSSPAEVRRTDGERAVTVSGTITSGDVEATSVEVEEALDDLDLPGDTEASIGGATEDIGESFGGLFFAIGASIALVYLILVAFFGSVISPLVILLSLPLTTAGAFGAMLLTGTALSVPALLGILLLIGIVVANAILLIDFAVQARDRHESASDAIFEAGQARLRPVLMTALATIGALVPLALGIGSGSVLISSGLAIPVVGGLITSTLLTLLVVPAAYSLVEGAKDWARRRHDNRRRRQQPALTSPGDGPEGGDPDDNDPGRGPDDNDPGRGPAGGPSTTQAGAPEERRGEAEEEPEEERELVGAGSSYGPQGSSSGNPNGSQTNQQFELGRAQGRIEYLQQELRRRERELGELQRGGRQGGGGTQR